MEVMGVLRVLRVLGGGKEYPDIPLGRPGSAEEAARAVLAVASPLFSYVSGETVRVTAGRNM